MKKKHLALLRFKFLQPVHAHKLSSLSHKQSNKKKRSEVCWFWKRFRSSVGSINALEALQSLETNSTSSFQSVKISGVTEESADFATRNLATLSMHACGFCKQTYTLSRVECSFVCSGRVTPKLAFSLFSNTRDSEQSKNECNSSNSTVSQILQVWK